MAALRRAQFHLGRAIPADTDISAGGRTVYAYLPSHGARRVGPAAAGRHRGQSPDLVRRWRPLLAYTTAEILVPWLMLFKAEERLSSSLAGLLIAAVPLVGALTRD